MKLTKVFPYLPKRAAVIAMTLLSVFAVSTVVLAGYGPDRPTKEYLGPGTSGFDYVTFNSFTNTTNWGDERDFMRAKHDGADNSTISDVVAVQEGDKIKVYMRVHNGADGSLNSDGSGSAEDLTVRVSIPEAADTSQDITGYVNATNAVPQEIYDTVTLNSGENVTLSFVPGSAQIHTNWLSGVSLSDEIFTDGVLIGDDALDGEMPGCFEYLAYVTFLVDIDREQIPGYEMEKEVRLEGSDNWSNNVVANPGDVVEYRVSVSNTGETTLYSIRLEDDLPNGMTYISGSTKVNGTSVSDGITTTGLTISKLNAGNTDHVTYKATVSEDKLECGEHVFTNTVTVSPQDQKSESDTATVTVDYGDCEEPETPVYRCDAVNIVKLDGRKVEISVDTTATPSDMVSVTGYTYTYGDGKTATTDQNKVTHTYANYGDYKVTVVVTFDVDGEEKAVECSAEVSFDTPPVTPPKELPNTGPVSFFATLFGASTLGTSVRSWLRSKRSLKSALLA